MAVGSISRVCLPPPFSLARFHGDVHRRVREAFPHPLAPVPSLPPPLSAWRSPCSAMGAACAHACVCERDSSCVLLRVLLHLRRRVQRHRCCSTLCTCAPAAGAQLGPDPNGSTEHALRDAHVAVPCRPACFRGSEHWQTSWLDIPGIQTLSRTHIHTYASKQSRSCRERAEAAAGSGASVGRTREAQAARLTHQGQAHPKQLPLGRTKRSAASLPASSQHPEVANSWL